MPGRTHNDRRCEKSAKEPWLLATSMSANAQTVVDIYSFRMQIEQNYRDTKNHRWGWALDQRRSRSYERIEVLLLMRRLHRSPGSPLAVPGSGSGTSTGARDATPTAPTCA